MRGLFVVLALLLPAGFVRAADQPTYAPPAAWVKPKPFPKAIGADTGTPTRAVSADVQVNFEGGARAYYYEGVTKIQTPQGLSALGNVALSWRPDVEALTIHKLHIVRGDQVIDLLADGHTFTVLRRENNLEMAVLDGALTAAIQPEGLQVGDLIDLSFTQISSDPVLQGHAEWLGGNIVAVPVDHLSLREIWPKSKTLRFRHTEGVVQPKVTATAEGNELTLAMDDTHPPKGPKGAPPRFFELGQLESTDFQSWAEISALMEPLFEKASSLAEASPVKAEAAKIKAASSDPKVQAMAALKLVEDKVRYLFLGMNNGGYVPAPADQTWSRRFGDCKGKTALLIALLHELGIEAEPALANMMHGDGLNERLPMLEAFDHVLVRAVISGKIYWLDGTRSGDRNLDDLPVPGFHWLLPVQKTGAELVRLTVPVPERSLTATDIHIDASAGIDVPAKVHAVATFRADPGILLNLQVKGAAPETREKNLREYWKKMLDWVDISQVDAAYDEKTGEERFTVDGSGKMEWKNYLGGAGREYQINGSTLGWRADFDREPGSKIDAPYAVAFPFFSEMEETIKLPHGGSGYFVDATDTERSAAGIVFKRNTKIVGDTLTMTASAKATVPEFPAAAAGQAKADLRALADVAVYLHAPLFNIDNGNVAIRGADKAGDLIEACRSKVLAGKNDRALADCEAALKLDPDNDDAKMARGFVYLRMSRYAAAIADYHDVLRRRPNSPTALFGLAQAELKSGAAANAQADLAAARAINTSIDTEFYAGLPTPKGGTPKVAQPSTPEEYIKMGRMLTSRHLYELAIVNFNTALQLDPKSAPAYGNRGYVYLQENRLDLAVPDFDQAVQLDPKQIMGLEGKAVLARRNDDLATAVALLTHVIELYPDEVWAHEERAEVLARLKRYDDAVQEMNLLLVKNPKASAWLNDRCWYRALAGKELAYALADCDASLKTKDQPAVRDSRGLVNLRLGKFDAALADYDKALAGQPNQSASLYGRGIAKLRKGAVIDGKADITAALAIDPKVEKQFADCGVTP